MGAAKSGCTFLLLFSKTTSAWNFRIKCVFNIKNITNLKNS